MKAVPKLIVIVGPTASGKSDLAISLAKKYGGEIISADSRQIYKGLDIGTAKITKKEMAGIPHHLIDILSVGETYSAETFKRDAARLIEEITERGSIPIIVGGTFFYIDMLLGKTSAPKVAPNETLRATLEASSAEDLFKKLGAADPKRAETIDRHNKRRLVRALEIVDALGTVPAVVKSKSPYNELILGIEIDKTMLRKRFEERGEAWLKNGFLKEIQTLLASGIPKKALSEIGFEYELGIDLALGNITQERFLQRFVEKNWQYAKRQSMWLKRDKSIVWISPSEKQEVDVLVEAFLRN
jgi:tRNA dimethylallyltransferase